MPVYTRHANNRTTPTIIKLFIKKQNEKCLYFTIIYYKAIRHFILIQSLTLPQSLMFALLRE